MRFSSHRSLAISVLFLVLLGSAPCVCSDRPPVESTATAEAASGGHCHPGEPNPAGSDAEAPRESPLCQHCQSERALVGKTKADALTAEGSWPIEVSADLWVLDQVGPIPQLYSHKAVLASPPSRAILGLTSVLLL